MKKPLTREYLKYLKSPEWKAKRREKLESVNFVCARKGDVRYKIMPSGDARPIDMCSGTLEVHHLHYRNLGRENLSDLMVLCSWHHKEEEMRKEVFRNYWRQFGKFRKSHRHE